MSNYLDGEIDRLDRDKLNTKERKAAAQERDGRPKKKLAPYKREHINVLVQDEYDEWLDDKHTFTD